MSESVVRHLNKAVDEGRLVVVVGTGVSMALTNGEHSTLSWTGLIRDGFSEGVSKGRISPDQARIWNPQIESKDLDDLLSAAEFMGRKLGSPDGDLYAKWLARTFKSIQPSNAEMQQALQCLHSRGAQFCTLNYDTLLEQVTGLPRICIEDTTNAMAWLRRETHGILHLHGAWDLPKSCVLGIRDYEATLGNDVRDFFQRTLGGLKTLLFIGCGGTFADPNFSELVRWLRGNLKGATPDHYGLVLSGEVDARSADASWNGFVEPIGYGESRGDLAAFLITSFETAKSTCSKKSPPEMTSGEADFERILNEYRAFLIKDCGQMTIEGVRADMDIAARKFDLERLFVPLEILPPVPDIPAGDPKREQKLAKWEKKHGKALAFGKVFAEKKHLALLAFPGGGKTLLLKRLAVAYADKGRLAASGDDLPELDLTPLLIRCREWRTHIRLPISTLLQKIPEITGQGQLVGLYEAFVPLLKSGRALLLVDGLDEIHNDGDRKTFVEHLEAFLQEYDSTRVVVTSREAGFALVAPSLARFCERWRVAPLSKDAIVALCDHWTTHMSGSAPETQEEGRQLKRRLLANPSLLRLAENPLLLTMLLVVKHGAGRLPLDRVGLYERATEVLLDTWNIQGHEPLSIKEAVPQLACVAFQLLQVGKQTATTKQLLGMLEEAREKVAQIRRYAKDSPDVFLKRVELRSSLLVEGGHQVEDGKVVPFYQFRHLTFQEYLAAVAITEGHYLDYATGDNVLTPLATTLLSEEWKEVVPMTAVLARKQAEPLMEALLREGVKIKTKHDNKVETKELKDWLRFPPRLPPAISRLLQCLVEEAEATPETLTAALRLAIYFCKSAQTDGDWVALARGPYGEEFIHQAWLLYRANDWAPQARVRNSFASLASIRHSGSHLSPSDRTSGIERLLASARVEETSIGLMTIVGDILRSGTRASVPTPMSYIVKFMFHDEQVVWEPAVWAWALLRHRNLVVEPVTPEILNLLLRLWLGDEGRRKSGVASFALCALFDVSRSEWSPKLTSVEVSKVRERASPKDDEVASYEPLAATVVAFFSEEAVWSDEELAEQIAGASAHTPRSEGVANSMLGQLGEAGRRHISETPRAKISLEVSSRAKASLGSPPTAIRPSPSRTRTPSGRRRSSGP